METLLADQSQEIRIRKASQMAVSTAMMLWVIWLAKTNRATRGIAYWLPTDGDLRDFVRGKFEPIIQQNPKLFADARIAGGADNVGLKFLWDTPTYWRGIKSKSAVKSISADALVFDEFDECEPAQVTQARERMSASDSKFMRELSTPTIPDFGIDKRFQDTDQCHVMFKCDSCGNWVCLEETFPACMMQHADGTYYRGCPKCKNELSLSDFEWVQKQPSAKIRGYQIAQLYSPWADLDAMMKDYQTTEFPGHFQNHKLGLAWISAADRVTREQVLALCDQNMPMKVYSNESCVLGIDVGSLLHCVVIKPGKPNRIVWIGTLLDFAEIDTLAKRFSCKGIVIDAMPEQHKVRETIKRVGMRMFACWYVDSQKGPYAWDEIDQKVAVNRTESLDVGTASIHAKTVVMPAQCSAVEDFATQCANIVKTVETDPETGDRKYSYRKVGPDHYRHAYNYALIALSKFASGAASVWR